MGLLKIYSELTLELSNGQAPFRGHGRSGSDGATISGAWLLNLQTGGSLPGLVDVIR
jgi:hypothetical protein